MGTRVHNVNSLYTYIDNSRQMEDLDCQIASKNGELKLLEQLEETYGKFGVRDVFGTTARSNKVRKEILKLQLVRNTLERQILWFELTALSED
jgi:hypothetical protein